MPTNSVQRATQSYVLALAERLTASGELLMITSHAPGDGSRRYEMMFANGARLGALGSSMAASILQGALAGALSRQVVIDTTKAAANV